MIQFPQKVCADILWLLVASFIHSSLTHLFGIITRCTDIPAGTRSTRNSKPPPSALKSSKVARLKNDVDDEKIAATDDDMPQYAPTTVYERKGAAKKSLHSKQAEMNKTPVQLSKRR